MYLLDLCNKSAVRKAPLLWFLWGIISLSVSGCSLLIGTITTDLPFFPPEIRKISLTYDQRAYGVARIEISVDFEDPDGDIGLDTVVSYRIDQVWNTGDWCWVLASPMSKLERKTIVGDASPKSEGLLFEPGRTRGTIKVEAIVAIWPESASCTAEVAVNMKDRAGNVSNTERKTLRIFVGF